MSIKSVSLVEQRSKSKMGLCLLCCHSTHQIDGLYANVRFWEYACWSILAGKGQLRAVLSEDYIGTKRLFRAAISTGPLSKKKRP